MKNSESVSPKFEPKGGKMGTYTKTKYPGVVYRVVPRIGGPGTEKSFYVMYKKDGKKIEEKVGRQYADKMTPAQANNIRSDLIEGRRLPRREIAKQKTETVWTVQNLWKKYKKDKESWNNNPL